MTPPASPALPAAPRRRVVLVAPPGTAWCRACGGSGIDRTNPASPCDCYRGLVPADEETR